ncbi:DUF6221 family protein [Streptomyces lunaelactis]|uniref:DUF6221 family protein n=1 Tax=Streptomyces lunaelactis TaxID=1535768 RepID=UPI0015853E88|nr:DUF6221 family protein [Streptomyces lunaelactis]NUL09052.1 hypothetical protein [Streptomyces lunaelactis]
MELVDFLRARLDEDEQVARAVEDRSAPWDGQWVADGNDAARTHNGHVLFYGHNWPLKAGLVDHIVRHDPARVLREVEAKRATLEWHQDAADEMEQAKLDLDNEAYQAARLERRLLGRAIRRDAAVYAGHPDYDASWKP